MFVIYGIVIIISMLVAVVIRGIVWVLSREATQEAVKAPLKPTSAATQPAIAGIPQDTVVITAVVAAMMGAHRIVRIDAPGRGYSDCRRPVVAPITLRTRLARRIDPEP